MIFNLHSFMIGLIDFPTEFSEDDCDTISQEIFTKSYHCEAAKSAPMTILGGAIFPTNLMHSLEAGRTVSSLS